MNLLLHGCIVWCRFEEIDEFFLICTDGLLLLPFRKGSTHLECDFHMRRLSMELRHAPLMRNIYEDIYSDRLYEDPDKGEQYLF